MQRRTGQKEPDMSLDFTVPTVDHGSLIFDKSEPMPLALAKAKSVFPIFGGTSPTEPTQTATTTTTEPPKTAPKPAGGDTPKAGEDQTAQIADLLQQVGNLTTQIGTLQTENQGYKQKEEEATRATQTKEQNLQKDLDGANQTIAQMDAVIQHLAKVNAIQSFKDAQWHSARQVLAELRDDEYEINVDLENGTAEVSGMDKALQRIAKECHWLVSKDLTQTQQTQTTQTTRQNSGNPPSNPSTAGSAADRRANMISRFSALGGRSPVAPK